MALTVTLTVLVPPPAAMLPLKLQVTSPLALLHDQPVPLVETNVSPVGNWSLTCAVVAAAVPELVTASAYVLWAPTDSAGVGADFTTARTGAETVLVLEPQLPAVVHAGPGVGGVGPPVGSIDA